MDSYKCFDCGAGIEIGADGDSPIICPDCGGSNLVQVFGLLAQTSGPV